MKRHPQSLNRGLAQEIYTPRRDAPTAVPGERPYAGWLYARVRAHLVRAHRIRRFGATFGIIGPPSLAEPMQRSIHRLLGNAPQVGWADQLHTEPGITVSYDERTALVRPAAGSVELEWGGVAGNVRTAAHAGVLARIHLGGAMPWSPGDPDIVRPARFHGLVAWRQDVVLHDLFVDGNRLPVRAARARIPRPARRARYGAIGVSVWW